MNVVRRSHYSEFHEESGRIGLLVIDELGGWRKKHGVASSLRPQGLPYLAPGPLHRPR